MLLSDASVQALLERDIVPCWECVHEVPQVTIDFGHGDVMHRTLKGNTCMYLLTPDGIVLDAFPGVYTPVDFLGQLRVSLGLVGKPEAEVLRWHQQICQADADAVSAGPRETTLTKAVVEAPLLGGLGVGLPPAVAGVEPQARTTFGIAFNRFTALLEDTSHEPQSAARVMRRARARSAAELVAEDSARSVRALRLAVHFMLADCAHLPRPADCRDVVFKRILGVPIDDPHLGLDAVDVPGTP